MTPRPIPPGSVYNAVIDGRPVVVFDRSQENWPGIRLGHGETGLIQSIEMDVSEYPTLELRATFYVDEQSLSTCGQRGSECPMMFRIDYVDVQGGERAYITGFYALHDPAAAIRWPVTPAALTTSGLIPTAGTHSNRAI